MKNLMKSLAGASGTLLTIIAVIADKLSKVDPQLTTILLYAFGGALVLCLIILGILYLVDYRVDKNGKPTKKVLRTSRSYLLQINKLADMLDKKLSKVFIRKAKKEFRKSRKEIKFKAKTEKAEKKDNVREPNFLQKLFRPKYRNNINFELFWYYRFVLKDAKNEDEIQRYFNEAQDLCKQIISLSRTLIQISQFNIRINLGRFVAKYTTNPIDAIKAYIDLIGFTYILNYDFVRGEKAINKGILLADYLLENNPTIEIYKECMMQKARALRHLSTTYYTYKKNHHNLEDIIKGEKILADEDFKKAFIVDKPIANEDNTVVLNYEIGYHRMQLGYDTNKIMHMLYEYYYSKNPMLITNAYEYLTLLDKDLEIINIMKTHPSKEENYDYDRHRHMKLLCLKLQLIRILKVQGLDKIKDEVNKENKDKEYDITKVDCDDLFTQIENIIKGNIYFDDAFEMYTNEKIHHCYKKADANINSVFYDTKNKKDN